jgi:hypothetical protein
MEMLDTFSAGTLTLLERYKRLSRASLPPYPERFAVADHFFSFGEDGWVVLHCIKSLDQRELNNKLKVTISPLSETKSESESCTVPFYGNLLNSARELYSNSCNCCCRYQNCAHE